MKGMFERLDINLYRARLKAIATNLTLTGSTVILFCVAPTNVMTLIDVLIMH